MSEEISANQIRELTTQLEEAKRRVQQLEEQAKKEEQAKEEERAKEEE